MPVIRIGGIYLMKHIESSFYTKNNTYKGVEADLRFVPNFMPKSDIKSP